MYNAFRFRDQKGNSGSVTATQNADSPLTEGMARDAGRIEFPISLGRTTWLTLQLKFRLKRCTS